MFETIIDEINIDSRTHATNAEAADQLMGTSGAPAADLAKMTLLHAEGSTKSKLRTSDHNKTRNTHHKSKHINNV